MTVPLPPPSSEALIPMKWKKDNKIGRTSIFSSETRERLLGLEFPIPYREHRTFWLLTEL